MKIKIFSLVTFVIVGTVFLMESATCTQAAETSKKYIISLPKHFNSMITQHSNNMVEKSRKKRKNSDDEDSDQPLEINNTLQDMLEATQDDPELEDEDLDDQYKTLQKEKKKARKNKKKKSKHRDLAEVESESKAESERRKWKKWKANKDKKRAKPATPKADTPAPETP